MEVTRTCIPSRGGGSPLVPNYEGGVCDSESSESDNERSTVSE